MTYRCSECSQETNPENLTFKASFEDLLKEKIKKIHPHWTNDDALCLRCLLKLKKFFENQVSKTGTFPITPGSI